ncbi:MAG: hypothetical protein AAFN94_01345 [Pseudomonadota bacterium]
MDVSWIATIGAAGLLGIGVAALVYSVRRSGDELVADPDAVDRLVKDIDRTRLSNVLSKD